MHNWKGKLLFSFYNNSKKIMLSFPLKNGGKERLGDLSQVTQPENGRAGSRQPGSGVSANVEPPDA